ncbi:PREDICTED: proproteinase E-like, partial [Mesitornis unicolor]|uniref:proproteinase E-like n=1 Tax=Mesitornis unicolor TaxID=54374 RepID=UPI00052823DD
SSRTYQVVLGEYDLDAREGPEQRVPVASTDIFVHPKWKSSCVACGNDIALLKLQRPAMLDAQVQGGERPPPDTVLPDGYPCYLSGWGRLSSAYWHGGDSGGPLNCQAADGHWEVHGIASFVSGLGCNALKKPTVFTRVSAFEDWIDE